MNKTKNVVVLLFSISAAVFLLTSCSEGIFNFTEETGNISINFTVDSGVSQEMDRVVYNLTNEQTGDTIRREASFWYDSSGQTAECYISRADAGYWTMNIIAYFADETIAAETEEHFEVVLAQTVLVELSYFYDANGSGIDAVYEKPVGSGPEPLIVFDNLGTLVAGYHTIGSPVEDSQFVSYLQCGGSGFDLYLESLRIQVPDGGFLEYNSGNARELTSAEIDLSPGRLTAILPDYTGTGTFSITATDVNGMESYIENNLSLPFDPVYGMAALNTYSGAATLFSGDYSKNDSEQAGCYIIYIVEKDSGTNLAEDFDIPEGYFAVYDPSATDLELYPVNEITGMMLDYYIVLATIDGYINDAELESAYTANWPNLSPENFPGWLYNNFPDRVNFVGLSVTQYYF